MKRSVARTILQPLAIAVALAMLVRLSFFQLYSIPSASMEPTLQIGDHIVVTPYHFFNDPPSPGDVVVFRSTTSDELLVKRVIATAGDLISSRGGRVMIGPHTLSENYLRDPAASGSIAPQIVPANCYFVMGDNRGNSFDSRNWGPLPAELIVGRVRMVLWSSASAPSEPTVQASTRHAGLPAIPTPLHVTRLFHPIE